MRRRICQLVEPGITIVGVGIASLMITGIIRPPFNAFSSAAYPFQQSVCLFPFLFPPGGVIPSQILGCFRVGSASGGLRAGYFVYDPALRHAIRDSLVFTLSYKGRLNRVIRGQNEQSGAFSPVRA